MAVKTGDLESELIEGVRDRVRERLPPGQVAMVDSFVRQYYHWVPPADLAGRSEEDLYGSALAQWRLTLERHPHQTKVRVYNPEEGDGFQSPFTIVEIVSDDMPFIVDSVTMELARQGCPINLLIHPVMRIRRDEQGRLLDVLEPDAPAGAVPAESILHAEVAREHDQARLRALVRGLERTVDDVTAAVGDWQAMRIRMLELANQVADAPGPVGLEEVEEVQAFLRWVADDHFVLLGYREYELTDDGHGKALQARPETGLGLLATPPTQPVKPLAPRAVELAEAPHLLVLTKTNAVSPVHRPVRMDYIGIKRFGPDGRVQGEYRFLGLYTTSAYRAAPRTIPIVRGKVDYILSRAAFPPDSHDAKALLEILESHPRDALFQVSAGDLFEIAMGLLGLGERPRVRLFVWRDALERFVSCLVTIPRDRFNTENRERIGRILLEAFHGDQLDFSLQLSESLLVRVHYIVRCAGGVSADPDIGALE
ncbi:MAG TPA: hypothetical protein VE983_05130, partial [Solirubrobacteraceae bacterium]|nr:hypothetical protein [Solirubrobacteraceae bacterium]